MREHDMAGAVVYRGYGPDNPAGSRLVVIEIDGEVTGPLPHQIKHSPSGLSWGYHGSGPADLARSLLIHVLGGAARCVVCEGTGEVVYDVSTGREIPSRCATSEFVVVDGETESQQRYSEPMGCLECEKGCAVLPSVYQPFKREVVANLADDGWTLTRAEILAWVAQHAKDARDER
jgi:hypothetical protein